MAALATEASEVFTFGLERELEYTGHITPAMHLHRLPKKLFVSADETQIKIWGPHGDVAKTAFPQSRRSMVSAISFSSTFNAILTAEVDMTVKAYSADTLELLEVFSLAQGRKQGDKARRASSKVCALLAVPKSMVLVGGDGGAELWKLDKSSKRRLASVGRLEFHLQLELHRVVTEAEVIKASVVPSEQRVIMWGMQWLSLYDMDLKPLASCSHPHEAEVVCCAWVHVVSIINTSLLTGGSDGVVNYWNVQTKQLVPLASSRALSDDHTIAAATAASLARQRGRRKSFQDEGEAMPASVRLEHSFQGHLRAVEMVCFYHRLEHNVRQRLAASCARDGKLKVWSLESFSIVYTLDFGLVDATASVFPLEPHFLAVSSSKVSGDGVGQRSTVSLMRFSAHLATPFATTNHSPVQVIAQSSVLPDLGPALEAAKEVPLRTANSTVLVSEDMAVRIIDGVAGRAISTLPPPPSSKVQVVKAFLCPMWQLLILWLTSQEIAIFFIPQQQSATRRLKGSGAAQEEASSSVKPVRGGANNDSTTPLLIRRFSIMEVRSGTLDKNLGKEVFNNVGLHHGRPIPAFDDLAPQGGLSPASGPTDGAGRDNTDWFLIVGTRRGTLQIFRLASILADLPIWERLSSHLSPGTWVPPEEGGVRGKGVAYENVDPRREEIEREHLQAMEGSRVPGQRPFPREALPVRLYGRWSAHDYPICMVESVAHRLMTVDEKHIFKIWDAAKMRCLFRYRLGDFSCQRPYIRPQLTFTSTRAHSELKVLMLTGVALGTATGAVQLVIADPDGDVTKEPEVLLSQSTHGAEVFQVDYLWTMDVFISAGRDDVLKIWSYNLALLREITFPQPLTCIGFRRCVDFDTAAGHGDIFVGFAGHLELVTMACWSRGVSDQLAVAFPTDEDLADHMSGTMSDGASPDFEEGICEQLERLEHQTALATTNSKTKDRADRPTSAEMASGCQGSLVAAARLAAAPAAARPGGVAEAAKARLQAGYAADFRGAPIVEIGTLARIPGVSLPVAGAASGAPALAPVHADDFGDTSSVLGAGFERSEVLDKGDFRAITRVDPGYYDWVVTPNALCDAPRDTAIRGTAAAGSVAVVTSIGIGHLRAEDDLTVDVPGKVRAGVPCALDGDVAPTFLRNPTRRERASRPSSPAEAKPPKLDRGPRRPFARPSPSSVGHPAQPEARAGAATETALKMALAFPPWDSSSPGSELPRAEGVSSTPVTTAMTARQRPPSTGDSGNDAWRGIRVGRGVPEQPPRPRMQAMANSEIDTAMLLKERGELDEAADEVDSNILTRMKKTKAEWLYYPSDGTGGHPKRTALKDAGMARIQMSTQWTATGRLVNPATAPPRQTIPGCDLGLLAAPLPHMRARPPMTRSEVTEQRIIQAALQGPPKVPNLSLQSGVPLPKTSQSTCSTTSRPSGRDSDGVSPRSTFRRTPSHSSVISLGSGGPLTYRDDAPAPARDARPRRAGNRVPMSAR